MPCDSPCKEVANSLFCVNFAKYWQLHHSSSELVHKPTEFLLVLHLNVRLEGLLILSFIATLGCEENLTLVCTTMYILVEKGLLKDLVH